MSRITIPNRPAGTDQRSIEQILADFDAITNDYNGNIDNTNLAAGLAQSANVNQSGQTVKGSSVISTLETRTNVAYGLIPTPDQVTGLVVPAGGILEIDYWATWSESVAGAARAAIFIGANQLTQAVAAFSATWTVVQAAATGSGTAAQNFPLFSFPGGLASTASRSLGQYSGDVATGQAMALGMYNPNSPTITQALGATVVSTAGTGFPPAIGGPCKVFGLPAGTYTVNVQFLASSGNVTVSNRRLYVVSKSWS